MPALNFIGVIYGPKRTPELSAAQLARQFNAYVRFNEIPCGHAASDRTAGGKKETHPFGL
jgi:hypothetical protein